MAIPGVEDAAFTCCLPIEGQFGLPFTDCGQARRPLEETTAGAGWMSASPDYYKLFKIPVVRGREFNEHDTAERAGRGADQRSVGEAILPQAESDRAADHGSA